MKRVFISLCFAGACVLFLAGCATYESSRTATQEREDYLLLREDVNRCQGKLETMEIEQQRILGEIQQLRKGQDENTKARLDDLERRISALDAARAADKQAIIDQISANVAKMMGGASASSGTTASKKAASKSASSSASMTGYEHVVKDGETLSTIAAAYKVKPSAIIEANDLKNPNMLQKGQKLFIPQ